ncbi:MAG: hypothetical protein HOV87_08650 [Catenulispora sp.]|nr:hypothetical protein [Catenulispora sp.]
MSKKNTKTTSARALADQRESSREAPDPNVVCGPADLSNRRPAWDTTRQASTGVNGPAGDAETALLAGAP